MYVTWEEFQKLQQRIIDLENDVEDLFQSLIAAKCRRKTIEEVIQKAFMDHYQIKSLREFIGEDYPKRGSQKRLKKVDPNVIEARKWFVSIMRQYLKKTTYPFTANYPFYHTSIETRNRKNLLGALNPATDRDWENRRLLYQLFTRIKTICKEEGIVSDTFTELQSLHS